MSLALTRNWMADMKLNGMLAALDKAVMDATQLHWTPTEFTNVLLQAEADYRRERKTTNLIRAAHLKDRVALEEFDFTAERSIGKTEIKDIHGLEWMRQGRPLLLIGQTGVGKSFIAQGAALQACLSGHSVLFMAVTDWLENLALARSAGTYLKFRDKLVRPDLLVLDNFGMRKLTATEAQDLCEILDARIGERAIANDVWLTRLANHLKEERYGCCAPSYRLYARRFLSYLQSEGLTVQTVQPSDVWLYLNTLRARRKSDHRARPSKYLRASHRSAIHMLLRLAHGQWPPAPVARSERERFHEGLISEYDIWMRDLRGLAKKTRWDRCAEARRFLEWLAGRGAPGRLASITVSDMDTYVAWRASAMSRRGLKGAIGHLRGFLRHLHRSGRITDIGSALISPRVYTLEGIPSALRAEDIDKVLHYTRADRRPIGLRDYAMLLLLSSYGLRAGEVVTLRLEDIDWEHDRLTVRHSKTGVCSDLPLLKAPGEAMLDYLRRGRPKTSSREIFVRARAPYRAFRNGSALYAALQERLRGAGVIPQGRRGPHAFRHARAVSLLKRDTPLKIIGDVLGHRSMQSTMAYLKLDSEALRGVALEIPAVTR